MAIFPADVVAEILSRLPVKPLLRFRSVSKIWCALIDSDHFIKSHLHRSIHTKNHRKIILTHTSVDSVSLDSLDVAEELDLPLVTDGEYIWSSGSCNGILVLWKPKYSLIALCNPSTLKCQQLPPPKPDSSSIFGTKPLCLGYDAVNDDYKVVRLNFFSEHVKSDFQVYSMKSNSWRAVEDFPYRICYKGQGWDGVFAHGALHWFVDIDDEGAHSGLAIAAFDLSTEETRLVSLPEIDVHMHLMVLEGSLCIVAKYLGVWVMKGYGVGETWNKLLSVAQISTMGAFGDVFPLAYSKNGCEVLLQDDRDFIWFDLEDNAVRRIQVQGLPRYIQAEVVVQSLLRLGSGGRTILNEQLIGD